MAEITWTLDAARCLEGMHEYIAADSPRSALDVVRGIYAKVHCFLSIRGLGSDMSRATIEMFAKGRMATIGSHI